MERLDGRGRRAIAVLALVFGTACYVAGVLGVPAVLVAALLTGSLGVALLGAAAVGALAGLVAVATPRRLEPVRRVTVSLRLAAPPVAGALLVVIAALAAPGPVLGAGLAAAVVAVVGLFVLRSGAGTHHARRVVGDAEPMAALPAPAGRTSVARQRLLNAGAGVIWLVLAVGAVLEGDGLAELTSPWTAFAAVLGVAFLLAALAGGRSLAVADAGVLATAPLSARLVEWDEFAGYYRGDRFVLVRSEPLAPDLVFDRDAVTADAFAVLDESLPEREHRAVPAGERRRRDREAAGER